MDCDKHIFSIYVENLSTLIEAATVTQTFTDKDLHKRITRVLRLQPEEHIIFFDKQIHVRACIQAKTFEQKKQVFLSVLSIDKNKPLVPEIMLCPSLLKKNSFEDVVYIASAMGANVIQPVLSEKVVRRWGQKKERARLEKIIISACEQSKHFSLPELCEPIALQEFVKTIDADTTKIFFDVDGDPVFSLLNSLHNNKIKKMVLVFGPEGGFANSEVDLLKKTGFACYKLTPTVLRSVEAVAAGLGCVRSVGC